MNDKDSKLLWETYQQLNEDLDSRDVLRSVLQLYSNWMGAASYDSSQNNERDRVLDERLKQVLDATNKEQWFQAAAMLNDQEQLTDAQIEQEFVDMDWYTNDRAIITRKMQEVFDSVNPPGDDEIQPGDTGLGPLDKYPDSYI